MVLPTIISHRYGQGGAERYRQKGRGIKKELLMVKPLVTELRISLKSIQQASRKRDIPLQSSRGALLVAPGYI